MVKFALQIEQKYCKSIDILKYIPSFFFSRNKMTFLVDKFHIGNHRRAICQSQTNPYKYKDVNNINTVVCEQTFSKLKKYQNALSSFSFPKSKIFYLLLFNLMNCKKKHISFYQC